MKLGDDDWEVLKSTVGASRAVELLETMGFAIGLRALGEARRDGRVSALRIGDTYRYDVEELERFATTELGRRA